MSKLLRASLTAAVFSLLVCGSAYAQMDFTTDDMEGEPQAEYDGKQVINFADDTIQGELTSPDIDYIEARKKARHKSLIKIRENFRTEILSSINDL